MFALSSYVHIHVESDLHNQKNVSLNIPSDFLYLENFHDYFALSHTVF